LISNLLTLWKILACHLVNKQILFPESSLEPHSESELQHGLGLKMAATLGIQWLIINSFSNE
jgi:hypothetical protein